MEELAKKQVETGAEIVTGNAYVDEHTIDEHYIEPNYKNKDVMMVNILSQKWHHEIWNRLIRKSLYDDYHLIALEKKNQGEDWRMTPLLLWFANGISKVNKMTYHYFMNQNSMCRTDKIWQDNFYFLYEDYCNFSSLITFFRGKNNKYYKCAKQGSAFKCYTIIDHAIDANDKICYVKFRGMIIDKYSDVLDCSLGWKISLFLKLPLSYYLLKLYKRVLCLSAHN